MFSSFCYAVPHSNGYTVLVENISLFFVLQPVFPTSFSSFFPHPVPYSAPLLLKVLWTQNNCELRKRRNKSGKKMERQQESKMAKSLSMYSVTENIYYSQLSPVAILLQPGRNCFTSYNTIKGLISLSLCAIVLQSSPPSHVSTCSGQQSSQHYFLV
jgi:hypothetical protein